MSRLLFAAARGARIQVRVFGDRNWRNAGYVPVGLVAGNPRRIHPDDEHLAYGPISSALRAEAAAFFDGRRCFDDAYAGTAFVDYATDADYSLSDRDVPLFLLFLAEALADEGM